MSNVGHDAWQHVSGLEQEKNVEIQKCRNVERWGFMPNKAINLQDSFLNQVRKENVPVTIHLVNGFQIKGSVRGFDNFTVVLDVMCKQQMVYKHAISTITPAHPIAGMFGAEHPEKKPENA